MASAYCSRVRMVSGSDSPLDTEEYCTPWVTGITPPPRRSMAAMKDEEVRVLGS